MNKEKEPWETILRTFVAVTIRRDIWKVTIAKEFAVDTGKVRYFPVVKKIYGEDGFIVNEIILHNGLFLAVLARGLMLFSSYATNDKILKLPSTSEHWGDGTQPIAGLFLEEAQAFEALKEKNLVQNDKRFREKTFVVIRKIAGNHPLFALPRDEREFQFQGINYDTLYWPEKRIVLPSQEVVCKNNSPFPSKAKPKKNLQCKAKKETVLNYRELALTPEEASALHRTLALTPKEASALQKTACAPQARIKPESPPKKKQPSIVQAVKKDIILYTQSGYVEESLENSLNKKIFKGTVHQLCEFTFHGVACYINEDEYKKYNFLYGKPVSGWKKCCDVEEDQHTIRLKLRI